MRCHPEVIIREVLVVLSHVGEARGAVKLDAVAVGRVAAAFLTEAPALIVFR